jgi:tol-pal system protein YbgF
MRSVIVLAFATLGTGCWVTKGEGDEMTKRIGNLEQSLEGRVKQLDESIEKATRVLARSSADIGAQVDQMTQDLAALNGQLAALTRSVDQLRADMAAKKTEVADLLARVDAIERTFGIGKGAATTGGMAKPDKGAMFDNAFRKLQGGQAAEARQMFRAYIQTFPGDDRSDNAQYFIGESFYKEKSYKEAIAEYQRLIDSYPQSDVVDLAFMSAGTAALDAKLCVDAGAYFGELVKRYPSSPFARTARQKLEVIKKKSKDPNVCAAGG